MYMIGQPGWLIVYYKWVSIFVFLYLDVIIKYCDKEFCYG